MSRTPLRSLSLLLEQAVKSFGKVQMSQTLLRPLSLLLA